jgi:hypothetical protein
MVRCEKTHKTVGDDNSAELEWLRIGAEYVVVSLLARPSEPILLQLTFRRRVIGWWDSRLFVTVSDRISSNWVSIIRRDGTWELGPPEFLRRGFWEDFYNDVPDVVLFARQELARMVREESVPEEDGASVLGFARLPNRRRPAPPAAAARRARVGTSRPPRPRARA